MFGSGIETFYRRYVEVMPASVFEYESFFTTARNMHNEVLHTFVERGLFVTVLYLIPVGFLIWSLFWSIRLSLCWKNIFMVMNRD